MNVLKYFIKEPVVGYLTNNVGPTGHLNNEVCNGSRSEVDMV